MDIQKSIKSATSGDKKALKFLYNRYKKQVMSLCLFFLKSQKDAEEAFNIVFDEVWKETVGSPATNETLFSYTVYEKTVQVTKSIIQKNRPDAFRDTGKADFSEVTDFSDINFSNPSEKEEKCILSALRGLQTRQCFVLTMNSAYGLQRHQLANALKLDSEKVETSLNRAKESIKKCFYNSESSSKRDLSEITKAIKIVFKNTADNTEIPETCEKKAIDDINTVSKLAVKRMLKIVGIIAAVCILIVGGIMAIKAVNGTATASSSDGSSSAQAVDENDLGAENALTGKHHVEIIVKDYGTIKAELDGDTAPISVGNFINLAKNKFYDGLTFHRIISGFMIQGGDPKGNGTGGSEQNIKGEFSANGVENKLSHTRGTISMARSNDFDSGSSQFFIMHADNTSLDGQYAAFGTVTSGMEIVDKICSDTPVTDNNGTVESANQPIISSIKIID